MATLPAPGPLGPWTHDKDTPYVPSPLLYGEYKPNVDIVRAYLADKEPAAREKVMWMNAVKAYDLKIDANGRSSLAGTN